MIVVDDGLATGSSMSAAVAALRLSRPKRIVVATPVASRDAAALLRGPADDVVVVATPEPFNAVGLWYDDFDQTSDDEVRSLLADGATSVERRLATLSEGPVTDTAAVDAHA